MSTALALANQVYAADQEGPLLTEKPLFGFVDIINGTGTDVTRVNWMEIGAQNTFNSTTDDGCGLRIALADSQQASLLHTQVTRFGITGIVIKTWLVGAQRKALVFFGSLYCITDM